MAQILLRFLHRRSNSAPATFTHSPPHSIFSHSNSPTFPPNPMSSHSSSATFPPNPMSRHSSSETFPPNPMSRHSSSETFPPNPMSRHSSNVSAHYQSAIQNSSNSIEEHRNSGAGDDRNTISTEVTENTGTGDDRNTMSTEVTENTGAGDDRNTISTEVTENTGTGDDRNTISTEVTENTGTGGDRNTISTEVTENTGTGDDEQIVVLPGVVGNPMIAIDCAGFSFAWREDVAEGLNIFTLLFTFVVGYLSTAYPKEKERRAKVRCICLIVSSLILIFVNGYKIWLDRTRDAALCLSYKDKREGNKVIYWKGFSHIFSCAVTITSLIAGVFQLHYFMDKESVHYNPYFIYWMGILGMFLAFLYALTQSIQVIRRPCLAKKTAGNPNMLTVNPLRSIRGVPPRGRQDFYEIDLEKDAMQMPI